MSTKEYIEQLKKYVQSQGITVYDYYFKYVKTIKSNEKFELPSFELDNPFLKSGDIQRLLMSNEERMPEYYAYTMTQIVEYYDGLLSREDIRDIVEEQLQDEEELSREDIKDIIGEEIDRELSRDDIYSILDEELSSTELVTETRPVDIRIADSLNGFAVIKEKNADRVHLYYHDAETDELTGEQVFTRKGLEADTGYYVNIVEFLDKMLGDLLDDNPNQESVTFSTEEDGEKSFNVALEEAFDTLRKQKAIRFGKELRGKKIESLKELIGLGSTEEDYKGNKLKTGFYVRRDVLKAIFAKYQINVTYREEKEKSTARTK